MHPGGGGCLRQSGSSGPAEFSSWLTGWSQWEFVCVFEGWGRQGWSKWISWALTGCLQPQKGWGVLRLGPVTLESHRETPLTPPHPFTLRPGPSWWYRAGPCKSPAFLLEGGGLMTHPPRRPLSWGKGVLPAETPSPFSLSSQTWSLGAGSKGGPGSRPQSGRQVWGPFPGLLFYSAAPTHRTPLPRVPVLPSPSGELLLTLNVQLKRHLL